MKLFFSLLLLLVSIAGNSTNFYFSAAGDDSRTNTQAQNSSTPLRTIARMNTLLSALSSGDSVLMKGGDTFVGTINFDQTTGIKFSSYGTGKAIISGLSSLTSWTSVGGNIYYASLDVNFLRLVIIDNKVREMGRYPNTGYIQYTSHGTTVVGGTAVNSSITGAGISSIPFNPTTGVALIRKVRYLTDGQRITGRSGTTLSLDWAEFGWGDPSQAPGFGMDGNGFIIQDHLSTLDIDGEWYYDKVNKRVYIYSSTNPSGRSILASAYQYGGNAVGALQVSINNLYFTGFNDKAIAADYSDNIHITNCVFYRIGGFASSLLNATGTPVITNNVIRYCLAGGVATYQTNNLQFTDNILDSIYPILSMGYSGDGAGNGVSAYGSNCYFARNRFTQIGFNAISTYGGNSWIMENNFIDGYCVTKDDGGALYQFGLSTTAKSGRIVRNNIILNGPGNYDAGLGAYASYQAYGQAYAIYLDNYSDHVLVQDNLVANVIGGGIHNSGNCNYNTYTGNIVYNAWPLSTLFLDIDGSSINNIDYNNNTIISTDTTVPAIFAEILAGSGLSNINHYGSFTNNIYSYPTAPNTRAIKLRNNIGGVTITNLTLAQWQSQYSKDLNSIISQVTTPDTSKTRIDYNATLSSVTVSLPGSYKSVASNTNVFSFLNLSPFTGRISLYYNGTIINNFGPGKKLKNAQGNNWKDTNGNIFKLP
jgi:hypothetical protein